MHHNHAPFTLQSLEATFNTKALVFHSEARDAVSVYMRGAYQCTHDDTGKLRAAHEISGFGKSLPDAVAHLKTRFSEGNQLIVSNRAVGVLDINAPETQEHLVTVYAHGRAGVTLPYEEGSVRALLALRR
ncbi:MAG: hypothetical protein DI551_10200 [Micavibrio aeruginosavorus]|uniref:Uncharacterized protein n=1 Tax=Micavibrio aeruginosavorus TaxID=349221 RepID=A0A2W5PPH7_9BACT|nr:MAG: hypothetical protein DI551_10200 [Micavibrio aeruginosavorus]